MRNAFAPAGVMSAHSTACFSVHATTEPSVMPRVLDLLAKRGLVPSQYHSILAGEAEDEMQIDFQVRQMDDKTQTRIAQCLRQIPDVTTVLTSRKD